MASIPKIVPISDFRQDAAGVLLSVREEKGPVVVTQRGRAAAVMLSVEAYERAERERHILELLVRGEKEIAAGEGHDLDHVLRDADTFLAQG
jgi:prevent-host-death family protein